MNEQCFVKMNDGINKGSIWRIWDLHVHSPATYGGEYSTFVTNARYCNAEVIGINDYCSIKGYDAVVKLGGVPSKIIFPVVEFRMHNLLTTKKNPNGVKINFHIIFDNDTTVFPKISTWIASLKCFDEKGNNVQLGTVEDLPKVSFDFEYVITSLKEYNLYDTHSIVWLPYDEYGGIDEIDPVMDGFFKLSLINKSHIIGSSTQKQINFFKWEDEKYNTEQYEVWFDKPKPCIKGSDAHKIDYPFGHLMNLQSQPSNRHCWINADTTFKGLKQIIVEPDRVFIGDEPDLLKRVRANKTKFIKSLSVNKVAGVTVDDVWFDNFHIELNSALVAIIGHKGGGKSAITDIIGLCGNTHQEPKNFSFLNNNKFRRPKPLNLSERFEATLLWEDGTPVTKRLNENPDKVLAERVKYIPQNFLERLCADVESDEFEKELKQIIYSHTPKDKRFGKSSLDELINYKSSLVNGEISHIQTDISNLNLEIVILEAKATDDFKKSVQNQLEIKRGEIAAHITVKPKKPASEEGSEESKKLVEILFLLREQIKTLEESIAELNQTKSTLTIKKEELNRSLQYYKNLDEQLKKVQDENNEFVQILIKNKIPQEDVFSYKIDTSKIATLIGSVTKEITDIDVLLDNELKESKPNQLKRLNAELKQRQEVLDKPAKEQQKYLDDIKSWEAKEKELEGNSEIQGTLKFFESQLAYLNDKLISELNAKYSERKKLVAELYSKKLSLIGISKELFQPVTQFINDFKELKKRYDVKIDVALELRSFADNFFTYINQNRIGTFCGKEEGYKRLSDIIEKTDFNTSDGFIQFTEELIDNLKNDKRNVDTTRVDINTQLRKGVELSKLYDYIHNSDFLQPVYNLKLGNKTLCELSPGERGALLLIFYLILDNDDIPLIIDQPEENIDNESVYHILVHFIKEVKEKRQIIIVTHNPNLAIVCDANQIINMQIEKENKNTVKFDSGAIEDDVMNKAIVNILEGTMPAFKNRDLKYIR
jgi:energy-coupling factor transporter ATP-binding protein EcfA2